MLKKLVGTVVALAFLGGIVLAAEFDGSIKSIDTSGKKITAKVKVKDEYVEKTFTYDEKDTKFSGKVGKKGARTEIATASELGKYIADNKRAAKRGVPAKLTTDGDTLKLTSVKVGGKRKKGKKKGSDLE